MAEKSGIKIAAQNRKAHHDYFVEDRFEAGIELFPGASGSADAAVQSLLNGTLIFNPDTVCSHHHHGEGHDCGSHSCGEDKHGCAGNH